MNWFTDLPLDVQLVLAIAAAAIVTIAAYSIASIRHKKPDPNDLPFLPLADAIKPRVNCNPSHDPEPTATYVIAPETQDGMPVVMTIPDAIAAGEIRQQQEASSHLGYDAPEIPCPAIQEAQRRLADLPPVMTITQPKQPRKCDVTRSEIAEAAALAAAGELRSNHKREKVAERWGYASVDSMRKALNRYGYRLNGQPKEAKQDA